jgi:uncharacterized protein YraI
VTSKIVFHSPAVLAVCIGVLLSIPGSSPALAQDPPLVLAFYYAWYDQDTWASGLTADQPVQPYLSSDPATIERHVGLAQAAGIDALIQSWYGPQESNNQTEASFRTLLDIAAAKGFHAAVDFETTGPFFTDQASIVDALRHLLAVHTQHPAYLRYQGKPVVFFWRQERFSIDEWTAIRAQVDPHHDSLWIAEGVDIAYQAIFDGHHLYSIAWSPNVERTLTDWSFRVRSYESQNGVDRLWVATVMPGYDDTKTDRKDAFAVDRQDGNYYRATWAAAIASQPDWIVITSFNEWVEGTMIEPSAAYGDLYLDLTRELATELKSGGRELEAEDQKGEKSSQESGAESHEAENSVQVEPFIRAKEAVRVRSGPGTDHLRIGRLSPGETARVVGRYSDSSWWQIEYAGADDGLGWVAAEFVTFVGNATSVPIVADAVRTPTRVRSQTPTVTPTASPTHTPSPTPSPLPAPPRVQQPRRTLTYTPTLTPAPSLTPTPTFTLTPSGPPTASPAPTSTPMLRASPVIRRRPVGLLWIGGGALVVAVGLGVLLLRTIHAKRNR